MGFGGVVVTVIYSNSVKDQSELQSSSKRRRSSGLSPVRINLVGCKMTPISLDFKSTSELLDFSRSELPQKSIFICF